MRSEGKTAATDTLSVRVRRGKTVVDGTVSLILSRTQEVREENYEWN